MRFQMNGIYSRITLFPGLGAFGRIRLAAVSRSSYLQEMRVVPTEHASETITEMSASFVSNIYLSGIFIYII